MKTPLFPPLRRITLAGILVPSVLLSSSPTWSQQPSGTTQPLVNPFTGLLLQQSGTAPARTPIPPSAPSGAQAPAAPSPAPAVNGDKQQAVAPTAATPLPPPGSGIQLSSTPNPGVTLKFDNADLYDVIQVILGDVLKLDYVIDPAVQGRITLKSTGAISMADIYSALETALSTSNISIVKQGKLYKVVRDANAARDAVSTTGTGPASVVMQVIPLQFVQANQLVNTLRNFVGPQAAITNDPTNRYLVVVDRAANVEKIVDMVKTLDVDYLEKIQIRLIPIQHGEASELAKELDALFKTSGVFNLTGTDTSKVYVLPVVRMNALLVATANDKLMQAAERWAKTLDAEPRNGLAAYVHVYPVVNSNAAHLANILQQIFGGPASTSSNPGASSLSSASGSAFGGSSTGTGGLGAGSAAQGAGLGGASNQAGATRTIERGNVPSQATTGTGAGLAGSVQVIADEVTNTLVVRASAQDFQQVRKIIERLDTLPRQVLVQVMIAEVALNDTLQYGVEWWLKSTLSHNGKSWPGFLGMEGSFTPSITQAAAGATPSVVGNASGLNYAVFGSAGQVIGMLNLLSNDTNVNILSAPHVVASDGKAAKVEVGNEVPVVTQTVSTPTSTLTGSTLTTSNSVQYRPTGILLEVKPSITASGRVTLSVSQEVSSKVDGNVSVGGSEYPAFSKRKVTTDVTLDDGKTVMLAGLIEETGNNRILGVPGLKDVPVVGALFGTTRKEARKTELLITITPYIITSREEGERLAGTFQESLHTLRGMLQKNTAIPALGRGAQAPQSGELAQ
ncbi:MAG: type II secretion system protein GspD [Burkholderiaceae bacterium]|nr:MAG: type II secretion system protein GspD [Burkholderiaceae bacterium]